MKIGVFPGLFPNVSKTFILDQVVGMIERGHDVRIFADYNDHSKNIHSMVEKYNLLDRTMYIQIPNSKPAAIFNSCKNLIYLAIRHPQIYFATPYLIKNISHRTVKEFVFRSPSVLDSNLDILHAHFGPIGISANLFDYADASDAFVMSFHGWGIREGKNQGGEIYNDLFDRCDCILANTNQTRRDLINLGADPEKVQIHHIGVNTEKFKSNRHRNNSGNVIRILTVARLHKMKGIKYGILGVKQLRENTDNMNIKYRIVGDGPEKQKIRETIKNNGLTDTITLCGALDEQGVINELRKSDIFLLPSISEGFGKVLVEAQSCAVPVVATNIGGIPEAVIPNTSALLVPPKCPKAIAQQLALLARDPSKRSKMGLAGREYVCENFNIQVLNDELESIYAKLIDG
jgi:colanic acid/amylovoran biosynthesis glycosyltransferase